MIETFENRLDSMDDSDYLRKLPLQVEYVCHSHSNGGYSNDHFLSVELKIGVERTYIVKNIKQFLQAVEEQKNISFTKKFTFDLSEQYFLGFRTL